MLGTGRHSGKVKGVAWFVAILLLLVFGYAVFPSAADRRAAKIEECARKVHNAAVLSGTEVDASSLCERTLTETGEIR